MRYYLAPMKGVTGYIYRNAYQKFFHNVDCYYTPFLAPTQHGSFTSRERNDILPEHNAGMRVVPQILTNRAEHFIRTAKELEQLGYTEVNLNLGCPAATVVSKKKGAGFLAEPDQLEHFLEEIYSGLSMDISIKTRIGVEQSSEFADLLDLYNQFPVKELIVHPRVQRDLYRNQPDWKAFAQAVRESKHELCYNGDLFTADDYQAFRAAFPTVEAVMLGRGILRNPGLLDEIQRQKPLDQRLLRQFHDAILQGYQQTFSGDKPVLFKMKELWSYMLPLLEHGEAYAKKLRKIEKIQQYQALVEQLFQENLQSNRCAVKDNGKKL